MTLRGGRGWVLPWSAPWLGQAPARLGLSGLLVEVCRGFDCVGRSRRKYPAPATPLAVPCLWFRPSPLWKRGRGWAVPQAAPDAVEAPAVLPRQASQPEVRRGLAPLRRSQRHSPAP